MDISSLQKTNGVNHKDTLGEPTQMENLLMVSRTVLRQAIDLVNDSLSADDQLTFQSNYIPGSTIGTPHMQNSALFGVAHRLGGAQGKHLRHARDHFALLVECIAGSPPRVLSYDTRTRNTPMEKSRHAAAEALQECIKRLEEHVPRAQLDEPLTLNAVTPYPQVLETTFGREVRGSLALGCEID